MYIVDLSKKDYLYQQQYLLRILYSHVLTATLKYEQNILHFIHDDFWTRSYQQIYIIPILLILDQITWIPTDNSINKNDSDANNNNNTNSDNDNRSKLNDENNIILAPLLIICSLKSHREKVFACIIHLNILKHIFVVNVRE